MKLVAIVRAPMSLDAAARAMADATGLALAEARMRLAPEPPALLARLTPDKADALVATLRKAGLATLAIDAQVPTDKDRTVAHSFSSGGGGITFTSRSGDAMQVVWPEVAAILRGVRASTSEVERREKSNRPSFSAALITGGLWVTRSAAQTVRSSEEATEQVVLVYARDGRSAMLSEYELDFSCLGPRMQASSTGNMAEMARLLQDHASEAFYDERLLRLGRRSLPFLAPAEWQTHTASVAVTRTSTTGSLDVLAEVIHQAVRESLLP